MIITKIVLTALICSVAAVTVKQIKPEFLPFVQIAAVLILLTVTLNGLSSLVEKLNDVIKYADSFITSSAFTLFKVLGIAFASKLAGEMCKDSGNSAIAVCVELAGKIIIIIMCVPLVQTILELSLSFIG